MNSEDVPNTDEVIRLPYTVEGTYTKERSRWCKENLRAPYRFYAGDKMLWYFADADEALLFKLRFG